MSRITGIDRRTLFAVNTVLSVGSGFTTNPVTTNIYRELAGYIRADSGSATITFRQSDNSNFTSALSSTVTVSQGVSTAFSLATLVGRYIDITVTPVVSATTMEIYGYGVMT